MGLLDSVGQMAGGMLGNSILPGVGGILGSEVGGIAGHLAGGILGQIFDQFQKDPIGTMADPMSLPSKLVDGVLGQFGAPKEFRSLVGFAMDPLGAIRNILAGQDKCDVRPVAPGGGQCSEPGLSTNGKDCVDTGRYLISAHEGEVKCYDKQTNTWVECKGDPHLSTSDGDKAQFQKNLTIDLPDGTELKIKTTPQDKNGVSFIDSVAVLKGEEAVVMTGFHDGKEGVNVGHVLNNADAVAGQWSDGTVLRAGKNVSDLTFASDGKEILGGDPTGRWGEWNLDDHGGKARYDSLKLPPSFLDQLGNIFHHCGGGQGTGGFDGPLGLPKQMLQTIIDALKNALGGLGGAAGGAGGAGGSRGGAGGITDGSRNTISPGESRGGVSGGGDPFNSDVIGGSSVVAILMQLANKERDSMYAKVDKLKHLKVPGENATPQEQKEYDKQKSELTSEIQQLQNAITQLTTMATNIQKTDHDTDMSIIRNFA
jgi:hypothetical protein